MSGTEDACARVTNYYNTNPFNPTFSANTVNRLAATAFGSWGTSGCLSGENQHAWYQMYSYHPAGVVTSKQLAVSGGSAVTASYTYDTAGRTVTRTYPVAIGGATQSDTFTSTFDGMGRPVTLTGSESPSPLTWVQNVQYDFAGRMSSLQYLAGTGYTTEAKGFNANGQLTSMAWSGSGSPVTGTLQYGYSATQNNGQIAQVVDSISGETIVYQYDSLKRLTSAASVPNTGSPVAAWTQTFQYDGFGNQTAQVLNGTTTAIPVNAATNQLSSASYDSNGNMTSGVGATFTFDVGNRVLSAAEVSGGVEYYGYAPDNRRFYKKLTSGAEEYTFYGARGEKLGVYNLTGSTMSALRTNVWFAGKLISENSNAVFPDRAGTNRASGARFHPYGDEITSTSNDRQKFATDTRDSYTGLDYADQRYYASSYGRFHTPDPSRKSMHAKVPRSWNRYSYVMGDPINRFDRHGTDCTEIADDDGGCCNNDDDCCDDDCCDDGGCCGDDCGGGGDPPPPPPPPPPPTCSITVFTRGVPFAASPAQHTYIEVMDSQGQGVDPNGDVLEGGPSSPHAPWKRVPYGNLVALQEAVPPPGTTITKGTFLGGTNPYTNSPLGSESGSGGGTCTDVMTLLTAVSDYKSGSGVAYAPVPDGSSTFNSNSFTYTLLNDIGLSAVFQPFIGWSPGWGQLVPGLQ
jgi:RHS repeat-associated protein